jgi:hypothetical protein
MPRLLAVVFLYSWIAAVPLTAGLITSDSFQADLNGTWTTWNNATGVTGITDSSGGWSLSYNVSTNLAANLTFNSPLTIELTNFSMVCSGPSACAAGYVTVDADFQLGAGSAIDWPIPYSFSATGTGPEIDVTGSVNGLGVGQDLSGPTYSFSTSSVFGLGNSGQVNSLSLSLGLVAYAIGNSTVSLPDSLMLAVGPANSVPEVGSGLLLATALAGAFGARRFLRRRRS